jgi:putative nucleotidyltransferase with HDIG domain
MNRSFVPLAAVFVPAAACLYALLLRADLSADVPVDSWGVVAFISVALLSEMLAVDFRFGTGKQQLRSSLAFLPFLASIVIFPPAVSVPMVAVVVAVSQLAIRRNEFLRACYNVAQAAISAGAAAFVYHGVVGGIVGFVPATAAFFGTNLILASIGIAHIRSSSFRSVLGQITGPRLANLRHDFLATPLVALLIAMYQQKPFLILIVLFPLFLIHHFYVSREQLIDAHTDLLRVLIKAIETRDPYTSGHSVRVSTLARKIATELGLQPSRIRKVDTAALLHDIGKIDPEYADVLQKPYSLSVEERLLIQTHAARGAAILQQLRSVDPEVVAAVMHHHEQYGGDGYPSGLQGAQIPLAARIIMLCDSIDAMLSDRPYRKALSVAQVEAELLRCSGTQFDPAIVKTIIDNGTLRDAEALLSRDAASTDYANVGQLGG